MAIGVSLFLVAGLWLAPSNVGAQSAVVPATLGHDPFPLVTADAKGEVRIKLAEVADGVAHFYTFRVGDASVEFFIVMTPDGVVRTAFNACDVCYRAKLGYRQDGAFMVCMNCGNQFSSLQIGVAKGGCNPSPLAARLDGTDVVIAASALAAGRVYFR